MSLILLFYPTSSDCDWLDHLYLLAAGSMKIRYRLRTQFLLIGAVAVLLAGLSWVHLWNKSDFCAGWATHYRQESQRLLDLADDAENRDEHAVGVSEYRVLSQRCVRMAELYEAVARRPWSPYPWKTEQWKLIDEDFPLPAK